MCGCLNILCYPDAQFAHGYAAANCTRQPKTTSGPRPFKRHVSAPCVPGVLRSCVFPSLPVSKSAREKTAGWEYLNLDTTLSRYNVIYPSPRARPLSGSLTVRCAWLQRASPRSSVALAWAMLVEPARRTVCGTPPPAARCCASRYSKPKRSRRR